MNLKYFSIAAYAVILSAMAACTAIGITPASPQTLAMDCASQAAVIENLAGVAPKMTSAEKVSVDANISLSKGYCSGTIPADTKSAQIAVEAATAQMSAILSIVSVR